MPNIPLCILRGQREACTGIAWLDTPTPLTSHLTTGAPLPEEGGGAGVVSQHTSSNSGTGSSSKSISSSGNGGTSVTSPRPGANGPNLAIPNLRANVTSPGLRAVSDTPSHLANKTDRKSGGVGGGGGGGGGQDRTTPEGVLDRERERGKGLGVHQHVLSVGRDGHVIVQDVRNGYFPRQHMARSIAVLSSQVLSYQHILSTHTLSTHPINSLQMYRYILSIDDKSYPHILSTHPLQPPYHPHIPQHSYAPLCFASLPTGTCGLFCRGRVSRRSAGIDG